MSFLANGLSTFLPSAAQEMATACPDRITILRANVTSGSMGGTAYDFTDATTVAANVPANIQNVSPRDMEYFARRGITVSNKIFIPQNIATRLGDGIRNPNDPKQFFVVKFISDMGGMHSAFKIYVDLIPMGFAGSAPATITSIVRSGTAAAQLTFSAPVTAAQWSGAELELQYAGIYYPGSAVTQVSAAVLNFTGALWTASPAGKPWRMQSAPPAVLYPQSGSIPLLSVQSADVIVDGMELVFSADTPAADWTPAVAQVSPNGVTWFSCSAVVNESPDTLHFTGLGFNPDNTYVWRFLTAPAYVLAPENGVFP